MRSDDREDVGPMPAARWTLEAVDLSDRPSQVADYLTRTEVCERTHLAPATLDDALLRPKISDPANPRGALCRPAARIGGVLKPTPLWTEAQVAEYLKRVKRKSKTRRANPRGKLPVLTAGQATAKGLASIKDIARIVPARVPGGKPGRAENTVRRYARDNHDFPPEVARASGHYGPPRGYRDQVAVLEWIARHENRSEVAVAS